MGRRQETEDKEADRAYELEMRRRKASQATFAMSLRIVAVVTWGLLMAAILVGGILFVISINSAKSAPQEGAIGAMTSTAFIGLYILARCIEKLLVAFRGTTGEKG